MKAYKVTISNTSSCTETKYNNTLTGFKSMGDAIKAANQAIRDIHGEMKNGGGLLFIRPVEDINAWVVYNGNTGSWLIVAKVEEYEEAATDTTELTNAGYCLDVYLNNTREIYDRYTVKAIAAVADAKRYDESQPARVDDSTAWKNLTFWITWQSVVKNAVKAAARLVQKYDHMTPTAKDIEQVTRNYASYIVECAKYELETATV